MGLFDLPGPLLGFIDGLLGLVLPDIVRLVLWGIFAGWLTMVLYRRFSNQEKIGELKAEQKIQQKKIADFDGEFDELMPLIFSTLGTGFRQLGLAIGPALLATVPILFLLAWVSGAFGYALPQAGDPVSLTVKPATQVLDITPGPAESVADGAYQLSWPAADNPVEVSSGSLELLRLPLEAAVPVLHEKQWWNLLFANPLGYLPEGTGIELIEVGIPPVVYLPFGPSWIQGWMFSFFLVFLVASVAFKFILKID